MAETAILNKFGEELRNWDRDNIAAVVNFVRIFSVYVPTREYWADGWSILKVRWAKRLTDKHFLAVDRAAKIIMERDLDQQQLEFV